MTAALAIAVATGVAIAADPSPQRTVRVIVGGSIPQRSGGPTKVGSSPVGPIPPTPTAIPEPPPAFGRVIYRATKAGSFESLGITMIMCRHRDAAPRRFAVEFFDQLGKKMTLFGASVIPNVPPGRKIVFVSEASPFHNPDPKYRDLYDVKASHMAGGVARVVSDAKVVHCIGKMRFDPGALAKTYWRGMGFYREGVGATPAPPGW